MFAASDSTSSSKPIAGQWYGPVQQHETLWKIATKAVKNQPGVHVWDMVEAIYQNNPQAFDHSQERMMIGAKLFIPNVVPAVKAVLPPSETAAEYYLADESTIEVVPYDVYQENPTATQRWRNEQRQSSTALVDGDPIAAFTEAQQYVSAKKTLAAGGFESVYQILSPLEEDYAGDPEFDYMLGISALDSGRPGNAVFALQRLIATKPEFPAARVELARAYFELGDDRAAKREFEAILASSPPEKVQLLATNYLAAIERRSVKYEEVTSRRVTVETGYDTNANSGTSAETIDVGGITFELDANTQNNESGYVGLQGAVTYSNPIRPRLRWQSAANVSHRNYQSAQFVSSTRAQLSTGLLWSKEGQSVGATLGAYYGLIKSDFNHASVALDLNYGNILYDAWLFNSTLRLGSVQFEENVDSQDVDQVLGALSLSKAHPYFRGGLFTFAVVGGRDYAREDDSSNGREIIGGRFAASARMTPSIQTNFGATLLGSHYDGLFLQQIRNDVQFSTVFDLVVTHPSYPDWSLRPYAQYVRTQSDIAVFDYSRVDVGLSVSKEIR